MKGQKNMTKKNGKLLTFVFDNDKFQMTDIVDQYGMPDKAMEAANNYFDLPMGAWFGPKDPGPGGKKDTWVWVRGNFWD